MHKAYKISLGAYSALFYGVSLSMKNIFFKYSTCLSLILKDICKKNIL
jgi:hypothetical protein